MKLLKQYHLVLLLPTIFLGCKYSLTAEDQAMLDAMTVGELKTTTTTSSTQPEITSQQKTSNLEEDGAVYTETTRATYSCGPDGGSKVVEHLDQDGNVISSKTYPLGKSSTFSTSCNFYQGDEPPLGDRPPPFRNNLQLKNHFHLDAKLSETAGAQHDQVSYSLDKNNIVRTHIHLNKLSFYATDATSRSSVHVKGEYDFNKNTLSGSGWIEVRSKNNESDTLKKLDFKFSEKDCETVVSKKVDDGITVEFEHCSPEQKSFQTISGKIFIHNDSLSAEKRNNLIVSQ